MRKLNPSQSYTMDMTEGTVFPKMISYALPLMASSMLQLLFNAADIVVVGRFSGDHSLAAVGSNASLVGLLTNLFVGLSVGTNVVVARLYGAKDHAGVSQVVHTSIAISMISGVFLAVFGFFFSRLLLVWMATPPEVLPLATLYLSIYFLGMPAVMVYNFGSAVLKAVGDTKRPLYYLTVAGFVNVILNLVFVINLKLDVAGVAIATVVSETISAVLVLRCLHKEQSDIHLDLKRLAITKDKFTQILRIGIPAGFQGIVFAISNVVIQSSVNSFGPIVMAGNSAGQSLEHFPYVAMNAFYQATMAFTSQSYGAGKTKRIHSIMLCGEFSALVFGGALSYLFLVFGHPLLSIYTTSEAVIQAGLTRMGIICRSYALCGMMDTMAGALRGLGYSVLPMLVSLFGSCVFRLVWLATVFRLEQYHTIQVVYYSYPISWTLTLCIHALVFVWAYKKIKRQACNCS